MFQFNNVSESWNFNIGNSFLVAIMLLFHELWEESNCVVAS